MPFDSIAAAKKDGFPTSAEGIALTLAQINKLAEIYDAIKKAETAKNPFSVAWTAWKKLYKKVDDRWTEIKAASIQFGTEQFAASEHRDNGIPSHAIQIEGKLIHLGTKNLAGWGVTAAAAEQIVAGMPGVPIRACPSRDPHACDFKFDNRSIVGYGVRAWVDGDWIMAAAAITDRDAAKKIEDGSWTPLGKGDWSVVGFPSKPVDNFITSGLTEGFQPAGISLVMTTPTTRPAFVGSGFDMVAAAVNHDHGDDTMEINEGGGTPVTYTQDDLDAKIKDALNAQKTEFDADAQKAHDAELVKQKTEAAETLAKQKVEYDEAITKLSADDKAAFDARLAEMTPTQDVEKMIAAAVTTAAAKTQADTLEAIERKNLSTEYSEMLTASVVLGAPYMTDNAIDPEKIATRMSEVGEMKVAAISDLIADGKMMLAAAAPAQSAFDQTVVPGQAPGINDQATKDMASIADLRDATGRV